MENDALHIFRSAIRALIQQKREAYKKEGEKFTQAMVAQAIGVDPDNLSGFLNGHRVYSELKREELAQYFGKTYLEILRLNENNFKTTPSTTQPSLDDLQKHRNERHHNIIDKFKDSELATQINEILLEIEKEDEQEFEETLEDLKHKLQKIRRRKQKAASPPKETGTGPNE